MRQRWNSEASRIGSTIRRYAAAFAIFSVCLGVNFASLSWNRIANSTAILWPANGMLLGAVLLSSQREWIRYIAYGFVASILARQAFHVPFSLTITFALANTATVALGAWAMRSSGDERRDLTQSHVLRRFLLYCVTIAPFCSSFIIFSSWLLRGRSPSVMMFANWFMSYSLGIAVVTPMILAVRRDELKRLFSAEERGKTGTLFSIFILLTLAVCAQQGYPISFLIFPGLLLLVFRLGLSGATIGVALVAIIATAFTANSRGPFSSMGEIPVLSKIVMLQFFLCVLLLTIYSVSRALSERDQLQEKLSKAYLEANGLAGRDHLTGLGNRRFFDEELQREWQRAIRNNTTLSLIMIDVDFFKNYNDHYGHPKGDACLQQVASVLASSLYRRTDIIARFGGEEFVIIVPGSSLNGIMTMAERLLKAVADLNLDHPTSKYGVVTVSAGAATIAPQRNDQALEDLTTILEKADSALYRAKQIGRNCAITVDLEATSSV